MANEVIFEPGSLRGTIQVPGDKSISHRALILGAAADGATRIIGANRGADVAATLDAVRQLGATVNEYGAELVVCGGKLRSPEATIDARNSGTTARLLMGLCAGQAVEARFDGDASLRRRPMERVARPLRALGAAVETTDGRLPATVHGVRRPAGGTFELELPSAQLKSAILLASLDASGEVRIRGDRHSRDHTERMLLRFGREVEYDGTTIVLRPGRLRAADVHVPGDLSAAAFFIVAAAVTPGSDLRVQSVGVNRTRTGFLDALAAMGANVVLEDEREVDGETVADIHVLTGRLRATQIGGELLVRAIDEIPVLAVAAAFAEGTTRVRDAADLRSKESDRIATVAQALRACGIEVAELPDGLEIHGGRPLRPSGSLRAFEDHRIAMAAAVLGAAVGPVVIDDARCIDISFPGFGALWTNAQRTASPVPRQC